MELFPSVVSRAKTVQVIQADPSGQANGSLQLVGISNSQMMTNLINKMRHKFISCIRKLNFFYILGCSINTKHWVLVTLCRCMPNYKFFLLWCQLEKHILYVIVNKMRRRDVGQL